MLTFIARATAFFGFAIVRRESSEQAEPHGIIKETFCSKLRELWAIRQRCRQIKLQQRKSWLNRNCDADIHTYANTNRDIHATSYTYITNSFDADASTDPAPTPIVRVAAIEPIDEANGR
jgi:hypothetical protein